MKATIINELAETISKRYDKDIVWIRKNLCEVDVYFLDLLKVIVGK